MKHIARPLNRRQALAGIATALAFGPTVALARSAATPAAKAAAARPVAGSPPARAAAWLDGADFGILPETAADQSPAVQAALDAAQQAARPLRLPAGHILVQNLNFPGSTEVWGQPGATILVGWKGAPIGRAFAANDLVLNGLAFSGAAGDAAAGGGLLEIEGSTGIRIGNCRFLTSTATGLLLNDAEATIENCGFDQLDIAIFSHNSRGLTVRSNQVTHCANGGILIWRDQPGPDGSIVSGNHVSGILAKAGGSGQNGNGINIFKADDVIVADNVISDCDFSAVRANSTRNVAIRGNTCTNLREVAIYSEFAFSGSAINGNIVDGAAAGISITNLDQGGRLAVCSGNIVRNIFPNSPTNPDVTPYGISAEADTAVTGNTVASVPGVGINAGYGAYLKNVLIAENVITDADTGIAVTVADGAGPVRIAGNMISGAKTAIIGTQWEKIASADLVADAANYPNVSLDGNFVSP
jgi:uncharacterized secreted repeat protein (TIGR03808 family)